MKGTVSLSAGDHADSLSSILANLVTSFLVPNLTLTVQSLLLSLHSPFLDPCIDKTNKITK